MFKKSAMIAAMIAAMMTGTSQADEMTVKAYATGYTPVTAGVVIINGNQPIEVTLPTVVDVYVGDVINVSGTIKVVTSAHLESAALEFLIK